MDDRLKYAPCGYVSITYDGIVTDVNQTFLNVMGYTYEDLVQKHFESIMTSENQQVFQSGFYPQINQTGQVEELFICLTDCNKQSIPFILNGRRYTSDGVEMIDCVLVQMKKRMDDEQGLRSAKKHMDYWQMDQALVKLEQIHTEIERKQAELMEINANLVELSITDKLTGLRNRRYFQEKLEEQMKLYGETEQPFSLIIIDIDYFKKVNDTWGHLTGDDVLETLGKILSSHARNGDVVARLGGEEFVLILPHADGPQSKKAAERLRLAVVGSPWKTGSITVSIGIATFTPEDTGVTLLQKADQAMYASKKNGRNQVTHIMDVQ
ncbi:diguanylate cyclase [Paenibacillus sp. HJL G12]|uniref:Diguanylate cyclase n=1 Tax=Paenibacillus dendrobii TaxID=2691084 RepID=A0A7X3IMI6_9BACL|nr:sensor domain-containing diguanylate cyclase [Paenibacillus dendrobii]MWV46300.1 diguanylate cyclase [Paenibacillus dendrobii]